MILEVIYVLRGDIWLKSKYKCVCVFGEVFIVLVLIELSYVVYLNLLNNWEMLLDVFLIEIEK